MSLQHIYPLGKGCPLERVLDDSIDLCSWIIGSGPSMCKVNLCKAPTQRKIPSTLQEHPDV